jgi:hypothetical protein
MDGIEKLSRFSLVACDQSYLDHIAKGAPLAPHLDSGDDDRNALNTMPASYSDPIYTGLADWTVFDRVNDPVTGFGATIYKRINAAGKTDFMVALQGTRGPSAQDWAGNLAFGVPKWRSDDGGQALLERLTSLLIGTKTEFNPEQDRITGDIYFTGQSLGGALAEYAAYDFRVRANQLVAAKRIPEFSNHRIALTTFNGLGGIAGLQELYGDAFTAHSDLLAGTITRHYWIVGDIVNRLGEGTGDLAGHNHLNGHGHEYRLDFFADGTVDGLPKWLPTADAHRIESGFYAGINRNHSASAFLDATPANIVPLHVTSLARFGTAFGNLYNSNDNARDGEAVARMVATLIHSTAFGRKEEIAEIVKASMESLYRSGTIGQKKYDVLLRSLPDMLADFARTSSAQEIQVRALLLAQMLDSIEESSTVTQDTVDAIHKADHYFDDRSRYVANPAMDAVRAITLATFDQWANKQDDKLRVSLTAARKLIADSIGDPALYVELRLLTQSHLDELVTALVDPDNPLEKFTYKVLYLAAANGLDTVMIAGQLVGFEAAWLRTLASLPGIAAATIHEYIVEVAEAMRPVAEALANAFPDFNADYSGTPVAFAEVTAFSEQREVVASFTAGLKSLAETAVALLTGSTNAYGEEIEASFRRSGEIVTAAAQEIILTREKANPFARGATPDPDASATANLEEGRAQGFTLFLPYAAGNRGQRIRLTLAGGSAEAFTVLSQSKTIDLGADGRFELSVNAGERQVTFALWAMDDVDSDETLTLKAQLVDAEGTPTHSEHQELTLTLDAEDEPAPDELEPTTRTILGDLAPVDSDPRQAGIQIRYDDLGNVITDPGIAEADRADTLYDSAGADLISSGGGADTVFRVRGGDDIIDLGDGDDDFWTRIVSSEQVHAKGAGGRDYLGAGFGSDTLEGGAGGDCLYGSSGSDQLYGDAKGEAADFISTGASQTGSGEQGELVDAEDGNDQVFTGAGNDLIAGGDGDDLVVTGGGDDWIWGDRNIWSIDDWRKWAISEKSEPTASGGTYTYEIAHILIESTDGSGDDTLYTGAGNDVVMSEDGDDMISLDDGDDRAWGGAGADLPPRWCRQRLPGWRLEPAERRRRLPRWRRRRRRAFLPVRERTCCSVALAMTTSGETVAAGLPRTAWTVRRQTTTVDDVTLFEAVFEHAAYYVDPGANDLLLRRCRRRLVVRRWRQRFARRRCRQRRRLW